MKKADILEDIIQKKKERVLLAKQAISEEELKTRIAGSAACRPFMEAVRKPHSISLIAEIKKASPSRGIIREEFDPLQIAKDYQEAGAQAISVLTEEDYFLGNIAYINEIKNAVNLPVLRKDFILEPYQIYESRAFQADAVLLIADLLSKEKLSELLQLAGTLGLDCLVEVHNEKELKKTLSLKTDLVGINNRDLHTFETDFETTQSLFPLIPKEKIVVVESGVKSYQDVLFLKILGVSAVLIGEAFMQSGDIKGKVEEIMGW